jgi:ATP-dependent RNA helicase DDX49/DBP8
LQKLAKDPFGIFSLVLTPSRELAFQIAEQFSLFGMGINLRTSVIVGGQDMTKQLEDLDKIPHIVVATPGRLLDMIGKSSILKEYLLNLQYLVLDEADRLFEETLLPDVKAVININFFKIFFSGNNYYYIFYIINLRLLNAILIFIL